VEKTAYPVFFVELAGTIRENLKERTTLAPDECDKIGRKIAEQIRREWGGISVYAPKGMKYDLTNRDMEIYRMFDGTNRSELCKQFNISERQLYRIIYSIDKHRAGIVSDPGPDKPDVP
jgi:Mor family transcriptional regulator